MRAFFFSYGEIMSRTYHYLGNKQLRDWIHVEIEEEGDNKKVTFVSRFHVGNRFPISWAYDAKEFTDDEILRDPPLANKCVAMFGLDVFVGSISV